MKAKEEVEFARTEAECSKKKAEEKAYDAGVAETEAALKAQVPGVCRLYCSQIWNEALKQASVDASSNLWKAECVFYPPAIEKGAAPSSEAQDAPEKVEVARPSAALEIISPQVLDKESGPSRMARADEGQGPDAPKEIARSVSGSSVSHIEGPVIVVEPLQSILLVEGFRDPKAFPAQPSLEGAKDKSME